MANAYRSPAHVGQVKSVKVLGGLALNDVSLLIIDRSNNLIFS